MSNSLAIAAVTATLQHLIADGLQNNIPDPLPSGYSTAGVTVTSQPPEKPAADEPRRVNIFLYHTQPNAAWRNMDLPNRVKPGETGFPPLALNLYYLVTAYGRDPNNDDLLSQFLLCNAMHTLHDHPLLDSAEIRDALEGNDLFEQIERVRITPHSLTLDDMFKLWSTLQAPARTSAAYQVSVVLVESRRPIKAAPPVIKRGEEDRGVDTVSDLLPVIESVSGPFKRPLARLGESLTIGGQHLKGEIVRVDIKSLRSETIFAPAALTQVEDDRIVAQLPEPGDTNDPNSPAVAWPVGRYELAVTVSSAGAKERPSNIVKFDLAPGITVAPNVAAAGDIQLTVTCTQRILPEQSVSLLFGDREIQIPAAVHSTPTDTFVVTVADVQSAPQPYTVRLRVDGVDSLPLEPGAVPPRFAQNQQVKV